MLVYRKVTLSSSPSTHLYTWMKKVMGHLASIQRLTLKTISLGLMNFIQVVVTFLGSYQTLNFSQSRVRNSKSYSKAWCQDYRFGELCLWPTTIHWHEKILKVAHAAKTFTVKTISLILKFITARAKTLTAKTSDFVIVVVNFWIVGICCFEFYFAVMNFNFLRKLLFLWWR